MKSLSVSKSKELKYYIKKIINYIYPRNITCIICDKPIKLSNSYSLCKNCFNELHFILDGCNKCGKPIVNYNLERESLINCNYCYNKTFYFDRAISCIEYNEISKKLVLDYKYKDKTYLKKYIVKFMKEKLEIENISADYILYVPLHKKRLKSRGFNQSEKIAKGLSKEINIPMLDCIRRIKNTKKLYKLSKKSRQRELKNGFKANNNISLLKNKDVILIDDIFTTGSTANEISKLLKLNSVNKIYVFTLLTRSIDTYIKN